jgi:hypothetical protein
MNGNKSDEIGFNGKLFLFNCLVVPVLLLIYGIVNSQGMRVSIVTLGMKLYRVPLPGFSYLERLKNLRDLDLAHVFSVFMLVAVWILTTALVEHLLFGVRSDSRLNTRLHTRFLYCLSATVLICDVAMFYRGIADQGGLLDEAGGVTPIIATVGYSGLLAFVAYFHVMLKKRIF